MENCIERKITGSVGVNEELVENLLADHAAGGISNLAARSETGHEVPEDQSSRLKELERKIAGNKTCSVGKTTFNFVYFAFFVRNTHAKLEVSK